jgi:ankyrin repeat protein
MKISKKQPYMVNKLPMLINSVLFGILLSGCKPLSLHMTGDKELIESQDDNPTDSKKNEAEEFDEGTIQAMLKENKLLDKLDEALFWSLQNRQPEVAKWLIIKEGVNVNAKDRDSRTPLHWAAERGYTDVAEMLLKSSANLNEKDNFGWSSLHW